MWEISAPRLMASRASAALPKNGTFLDIGANLGYYSLLFAHAGFNVVAVEPMARNRQAIEGSLCLNPKLRTRVKVVPVALVSPAELNERPCVIKSTDYKINIGNGRLVCGRGDVCQAGDANCEVVPVKTLDAVLAEVAPASVDVVKMDVEVHECQVLAGGDTLFSSFHPHLLQIETAFGDSGKCVRAKAAEHGYRNKTVRADTFMVSTGTRLPSNTPMPVIQVVSEVEATLPRRSCVPEGMRKARASAGFDMVVLGDNDIVSASIYHQHVWEIPEPNGIASRAGTSLPEPGTFLDIGANLGYYSLLFAQAGFNVVAVEAMARNRQAIEGSLCLNPGLRARVKVVPVALVSPEELSSTRCVIKSTSYKINVGNGHLLCGPEEVCQAGDANCEVVPVKTLDAVLAEVAPASVDVVKMDVEVHECQVLAGGDTLFSSFHPHLLQIETAFGDSGKCVQAKAAEHGYRAKTVGADTFMVSTGTRLPSNTPMPVMQVVSEVEATLPRRSCVPEGMRKARVSAGFDMVVLGDNDIVSASIYHQHVWEIPEPNGIASRAGTSLPEPGTFLDIGANLGYYSLLFAQAGFNVVAVEAMARNRQAIEGSLCLNPGLRARVKVVPVALVSPEELSSTRCVIKSTNYKINIGNGHLLCGPGEVCQVGDANCEVVPVKTLDAVLAEVAPASVDVVKMDVEVHECQVLAGGDTLFSSFHPHLLQIETAFGDSGKCVRAKAAEHGYRAKTVGADTFMVSTGTRLPSNTPMPVMQVVSEVEATLPRRSCVPEGMRKARASAGFDMVVLGDNDIVSASIYHQHVWEIPELNSIASRAGTSLPEPGTFLDIGANLGYYSLLFAQAGFNVVAVEAMARNRQAIEGSLCLNPGLRARVKVVPVALVSPEELSSTRCVIKSTNYKINVGNGHLLCGPEEVCQAGDANCEVVPVKTLDAVLAEVAPASVDVVKMDVEVHECQVLAGGDTLFSSFHPHLLQIETAFGDSGKCVQAKAAEHGYRTKTMEGDTIMVRS